MSPRSLLLMMAFTFPLLALADDLVIPVGQQGADQTSLKLPTRGLKTDAVEATFGTPLGKGAPVGNPPISSWEYPGYQVYFEGDRVLHTVLKPVPAEPPIPATPASTAPAEVVPVPDAAPIVEAPIPDSAPVMATP